MHVEAKRGIGNGDGNKNCDPSLTKTFDDTLHEFRTLELGLQQKQTSSGIGFAHPGVN